MRSGLRVLILLFVLLLVLGFTIGERAWVRGWGRPLQVTVYPIAVDDASREYLDRLAAADFEGIGAWLSQEARTRWQQPIPAPHIELAAPLHELPPAPPPAASRLAAVKFSLQLRWYAFRHTPFWHSLGRVRLFVLYYEPRDHEPLPHSLGMQKGLIGVVHVFASDEQRAQNAVVITHELLHALGATDKYDRTTDQPLFPIGYADPYAQPPLPQEKAEIMAGRIPVAAGKAVMPDGLAHTMIGYATAAEIGW
jgi:hypothetical protein